LATRWIRYSLLLFCLVQVGLSQPFAEWLLPLIKQHFPDFPQRSAQDFYAAENVIKSPSLIRVEADEVRHCTGCRILSIHLLT
jgi:Zn-dependent M32 family carboxypeptidase